MKKLILLLFLITSFSCSDDDQETKVIDGPHIGVESFLIRSKNDISIEANDGSTINDYPFPVGVVNEFSGHNFTGYVSPEFSGNTTVIATLLSSSMTGSIHYEGNNFQIGESFNVSEFFSSSYSVSGKFIYVGEEAGVHDIVMKFETNRGTIIEKNDSILFQ